MRWRLAALISIMVLAVAAIAVASSHVVRFYVDGAEVHSQSLEPGSHDLRVTVDGLLDESFTVEIPEHLVIDSDTLIENETLTLRAGDSIEFRNGARLMFGEGASADWQGTPTTTWSDDGAVQNLDRDIDIFGSGDIMFMAGSEPSVIRFVEIDLQPLEEVNHYPLHWHFVGDGSRGTLVEGVVVKNSTNRAFVPHASHGITFRDTIAKNVAGEAYWWNPVAPDDSDLNNSNDILFDHVLADGITNAVGDSRGNRLSAFDLRQGVGNIVRDSVALNIHPVNRNNCSGFEWPEGTGGQPSVWIFERNKTFGSDCNGIFVWQNTGGVHIIDGFVSTEPIEHGAYSNFYEYRNVDVPGVIVHATGWRMDGGSIGDVTTRRHRKEGTVTFENLTVDSFTVANSFNGGDVPAHYVFNNTTLDCVDVTWTGAVPGTSVTIDGNLCVEGGDQPMTLPVTSGLGGHYDAAAITGLSNGDPVAQWDDESGLARHAVQATSANRPTYQTGVLNGKPVLRFDGTNDELIYSGGTGTRTNQPNTFFFVAKYSGPTDGVNRFIAAGVHTDWQNNFLVSGSPYRWRAFAGSLGTSNLSVNSDFHYLTAVYNGNATFIRRSGTQDSSINNGTKGFQPIAIGSNATGGGFWNGDIAEVIWYDRQLTTQEISDVEAYLIAKWFTAGPTGLAVQLSPAVISATAQALTPVVSEPPVVVNLVPATLTAQPSALDATPAPFSTSLTPSTITSTASALDEVTAGLVVQLSPATATTSSSELSPVVSDAPVSVELTPANLSLAASPVSPVIAGAPVVVDLAVAQLTFQPIALTPSPDGLEVTLSPSILTSSVNALSSTLSPFSTELTPSTFTLDASTLEIVGPDPILPVEISAQRTYESAGRSYNPPTGRTYH